MDPRERWRLGLAVLTAYMGPPDRRAADITAVASEFDPREVLFGVLAVARDLLAVIETQGGVSPGEILQALASQDASAAARNEGRSAGDAGPDPGHAGRETGENGRDTGETGPGGGSAG